MKEKLNKKTKICALILVAVIFLPAIFSCAKDKEDVPSDINVTGENNQAAAVDNGEEESKPADPRQINLDLYDYPDVNYDQHEFKILIRGQQDEWDSQDIVAEEDSADVVESAVYKRNLEIEEKLNIKITGVWVLIGEQISKLKKAVTAGDNSYDAVMLNLEDASNATKQGLLINLADTSGVNLSNPWWDQSIMQETSVMNKTYFATGDISIMDNDGTWTMMFNKKILKDLELPDIYDIVKKGEWTVDKFMELGKGATFDLDGDGVITYLDQVAFATTADSVQGLFYSQGLRIVKKDENDLPYYALTGDAVMTSLEKLYEVFRGNGDFTMLSGDYPNTPHGGSTHLVVQDAFEQNRALFYGEVMQCVKRLRQMETEFGIIPFPKANAEQKQYNTYVHSWASATAAIPRGGDNDDRTSAIIEALAYGGYKYITPAYYDVALKSKYARDDESSEMLDIILDGRLADLGYVDKYGGLMGNFQSNITGKKNIFASTIEKAEAKIQKDIDKAIEKYDELP
ncbi:MAG: extracellular solute-binding protein [Oscillospiraceae bacterium]|nr:extracellular solute-binding protein [Oscillospiraceae bacterium]